MCPLTWVMERHKHKDARLRRAAGLALNDGVSPESRSSDLLKHAACGVHDKHQCRDLLHAEEPVEEYWHGKTMTKYNIKQLTIIKYYVERDIFTKLWGFFWETQQRPVKLPEEGFVAHGVSEVSQYIQCCLSSQSGCFHMEVVMRWEKRWGAVLVDAPFGPFMAATVQYTSMTTFAWKGNVFKALWGELVK